MPGFSNLLNQAAQEAARVNAQVGPAMGPPPPGTPEFELWRNNPVFMDYQRGRMNELMDGMPVAPAGRHPVYGGSIYGGGVTQTAPLLPPDPITEALSQVQVQSNPRMGILQRMRANKDARRMARMQAKLQAIMESRGR